tara:strand:- start:123781 stop:123951 length:171 start_codon:yes stop_codon:yes gene_type:complete
MGGPVATPKERPDIFILLPDMSVIGGDIFLLPDVVAHFPLHPPKYDRFMTGRNVIL